LNNKRGNIAGFYAIHLILFLSGFTFLIYEVIWNRMLSLVLGATVSASTVVLVSYMAGLGLGAFVLGKHANKSNKPAKLLSLLLFGIGLFGFTNYIILKTNLQKLYLIFGDMNFSGSLTETIIFSISIFLLLIPTFLMGGVLPIISKIIIRTNKTISSGLGRIYAIETLGSTLGGLLTGFLFLGNLGQKNTVILAVAINVLSGIYLLISKKFQPQASIQKGEKPVIKSQKGSLVNLSSANALFNKLIALPATFIFGFSILGLQVIWLRIFKIYLTNTSYTFALISSLIILGFFAGSWTFKNLSGRIKNYGQTMVYTLAILGLLAGFGLLVLVKMPEFIMFPFETLLSKPFIKLIIMPMAGSLIVVFPPAMVSGFAFPLACRIVSNNKENISLTVGNILTFNSLGSFLGPLFATFLFIPWLGVGISILVIMLLVLSTSLFLVFKLRLTGSAKFLKPLLIIVSASILLIIFIKPMISILPPSFSKVEKEVLFYKETMEASLVVSREKNARSEVKTTYVNNAVVIGSTYDAVKAVKMIGHLPFFAGLRCSNALVVGFGIGVTASTIASHTEVKAIDCIELAGGLKEAANFYKDINNNVINDKRLHFIPGDGRHFLQKTRKKYDLISSDPTHPILGSANLYSREYFELCKIHLNAGGMVSQYLPLHKLRPVDFQGIIKTFYSVFPEATVWLGHTHAILIGSTEPLNIDFSEWEQNISKTGRDPVFYTNPYHLAACLMLNKRQVTGIDKTINTDNRSYLEFFSYACFDTDNLNRNISFLSESRADINEVFTNIPDAGQMDHFVEGSRYFIKSAIYFQAGERQKSLDELRKAVKANPENQEYPFLIKFYHNVPN